MSSSKEYLDYILEKISDQQAVSYRKMMGEYIIYYRGRIAAYICDDRLLFKPVAAVFERIPDAKLEPPYPGAGDMIFVEETDNSEFMSELFEAAYEQLSPPTPKKKRKEP